MRIQDSGQIIENKLSERDDNGFQSFWEKFRKAALTEKPEQIAAFVQFPLKTRGTFDSDPIIEYNREKALPIIQTFFNQWAGIDLEGSTEMDIVRKTLIVDSVNLQDRYVRVGDMVFEKQLEVGWKLTFIYFKNDTVESLSK